MVNPFRKKPKGNPTKTAIIKHDGKSQSTNQVRSEVIDLSITRRSVTQQVTFRGFNSPSGRF
ncbi:MAG: hypothetical protein IIB85_02365 [Chloroflexi bacterium]|nr:hypothetical protein [Chloroflexota bacterium]